ncbi:hypothetical protein BLNAU_17323 [Blattamonas nauphoetae]|uniref:Uncharacterized protein n=1 Tax=Blattamonas nauphoetae TaxID=2049346 RepID=A0ABQ9X7D2_9EUKA|nr:hypothetical protein BLNAU_17323 [Blattamonas nauphoetae]
MRLALRTFVSILIASSQDKKTDAYEPTCDRMERESLLTDAAKMEWDAAQPNYDQFGEIDITMSGHSDISGELPGSTNIRHIDKHQLAGDPKLTSFIAAVFSAEEERADMPDTTSEPKTEKVKRTDQQKSVRSAKSQRSTLSAEAGVESYILRDITPSRSQTHRSSAAQQVDLAGSFMISERNIHTKWMTLMILVQIANHPHSQIAFNKTTGMGITPALFLPAALNITLLASIANNGLLSQHVVGLLANLVDHLPLNTLSFASRTRGKEQTTIMITTASPLCVSILQLRHDYVQATNNICCSTLLIRCEMGKM